MFETILRIFRKRSEKSHAPHSIVLEGISRHAAGVAQEGLTKDFRVEWTAKGRRVLLDNPQLFELFKFFRDNDKYRYPEKIPDSVEVQVKGGKAQVTRIAEPSFVPPGRQALLKVFVFS